MVLGTRLSRPESHRRRDTSTSTWRFQHSHRKMEPNVVHGSYSRQIRRNYELVRHNRGLGKQQDWTRRSRQPAIRIATSKSKNRRHASLSPTILPTLSEHDSWINS